MQTRLRSAASTALIALLCSAAVGSASSLSFSVTCSPEGSRTVTATTAACTAENTGYRTEWINYEDDIPSKPPEIIDDPTYKWIIGVKSDIDFNQLVATGGLRTISAGVEGYAFTKFGYNAYPLEVSAEASFDDNIFIWWQGDDGSPRYLTPDMQAYNSGIPGGGGFGSVGDITVVGLERGEYATGNIPISRLTPIPISAKAQAHVVCDGSIPYNYFCNVMSNPRASGSVSIGLRVTGNTDYYFWTESGYRYGLPEENYRVFDAETPEPATWAGVAAALLGIALCAGDCSVPGKRAKFYLTT